MNPKQPDNNFQEYLQPTEFINSNSAEVIEFAQCCVDDTDTPIEQSIKIYYVVRDSIRYDPYEITFDTERYRASWISGSKTGFCIQKAILLAAMARALNIPSRLGFADVKNHLATDKLLKLMRTDEFVFHGYTELFLNGKWVKATPAFNKSLCEKFNVAPLEFDGINDSIFHPFDKAGNKNMEYIRDHGNFPDLPFEMMKKAFYNAYPHLFSEGDIASRSGFTDKNKTGYE